MLSSVLKKAQKGHYAIPGFNFSGIEELRGILNAAAALSPVIVMTSVNIGNYWGLKGVASYVRAMAEDMDIPFVLHQDHTKDDDTLRRCVDYGYTSVMIDASSMKRFEENVEITNRVRDYAHAFGVSVEAELGYINGAEEGAGEDDEMLTRPEDARRFTGLTDIGALAVAVGTAHGFYIKPRNWILNVWRKSAR